MDAMERRSERRYSVYESVVLGVLGAPEVEYHTATLIDVSSSGFRLVSGLSLNVGTEVLVTLGSVAIFGTVCHCTAHPGESFTTGVRIDRIEPTAEENWEDVVQHAKFRRPAAAGSGGGSSVTSTDGA
jgi:hypothetical protein